MELKFTWDFVLDTKALQEDEDGTLYIEGYASDFDMDRDGEFVEPEAITKAIERYMKNPVLIFHHKMSELMGNIAEAKIDGKGLWVRAAVPKPEPGTERMNRYRDVKSGRLRGFSIGGFFKKAGQRIAEMDLVEISLTPTPVNPRTLGALAAKAIAETPEISAESVIAVNRAVDEFEAAYAALG